MSDTTKKWEEYMLRIYRDGGVPRPLGTVKLQDIEDKAREKMKDYPGTFMHAAGSAGTGSTCRANLRAFEKYGIMPRMMLTASNEGTLETTIFGVKHPSPIFVSPIGVQGIFHPDGELATAAAAKNMGVPFVMSNNSSRSMEEVAKANGTSHRWYQMSWPRTEEVTSSLLKRARANGFTALLVTLEVRGLGWRPHDLDLGYHPYSYGIGNQVGKADPVFMARYGRSPIHERPKFPYTPKDHEHYRSQDQEMRKIGLDWMEEINSGGRHSWEDLKTLKKLWGGPLIVKGIMHPLDAEKAMDCGADGIVVSNQGGRQFDGGIPALYALELITSSKRIQEAQRSGKFTILFDSGIRTGSDIIKAMALGAQGILLGRPWVYGLMLGGRAGVEQVLQMILADLYTTLGMAGYENLREIQGKRDSVVVRYSSTDSKL